jgi:3-oxoacyl-[acyl-carrier protein] reductase
MGLLDNKVAIITGAGGGLGEAYAKLFASEGASVVVNDLGGPRDGSGKDETYAQKVADAIKKDGGKAIANGSDVSTMEGGQKLFDDAIKAFGKVDILVNNAGVSHNPAAMDEISEADFDRVFNVNMKSVYLTARHLVPHFKARKTGAILNVASTAAVSPRPRLSWYNASKGWMVTATKSMAIELAPFGVRVNAINPVAGETPLLKTFMGEDTPEMRAKFLATIPLGRFSTPEDMGNAACFLCSDEASMVTGVAMEVDGGRVI